MNFLSDCCHNHFPPSNCSHYLLLSCCCIFTVAFFKRSKDIFLKIHKKDALRDTTVDFSHHASDVSLKGAQKGNCMSSAHVDVASMYLQGFLFLAVK
jgi:hypothetical protein